GEIAAQEKIMPLRAAQSDWQVRCGQHATDGVQVRLGAEDKERWRERIAQLMRDAFRVNDPHHHALLIGVNVKDPTIDPIQYLVAPGETGSLSANAESVCAAPATSQSK
ncbi:MAG: hypothetical protein HGB05_16205, partial [Chloroflexi bacterium]|nr:hypothetical protein [Chloroflexota bacterium]